MIMKAEKLLFPTKQLFLWKKVVTSSKKHVEVENCLNFWNNSSPSDVGTEGKCLKFNEIIEN